MLSVEVDEMGGRISYPYFRLPRDSGSELRHRVPVEKCGHEEQRTGESAEHFLEFFMALRVDWSVAGHRLDQYQPIVVCRVDNKIGHLSVNVNSHTKLLECFLVEYSELLLGIAYIQEMCSGRPPWAEIVNEYDLLAYCGVLGTTRGWRHREGRQV